jgi:hypothetical protein
MIASKLIDRVISGTDTVSAIDSMFDTDSLLEFAQELGGPEVGLSLLKGEVDNFGLYVEISGDDAEGSIELNSDKEGALVGTFKWDRMSIDEVTNTYIYASHSDLWGGGKYKGRYWGILGYLALIEHVTNKLKGLIAPFGSFIASTGKTKAKTKENIEELSMRGFTTSAAMNVWKSLQSSGYIASKQVNLTFASSQVYPGHNVNRKMTVEVFYYTGPKIVGVGGIISSSKPYKKPYKLSADVLAAVR